MKKILFSIKNISAHLIYFFAITLLLLNTLPYSSHAQIGELNQESSQQFGDYTVHYTAFNSTFILPDIAKTYQLTRAKNQVLVNISVHNKEGVAVEATLEGHTKNLMQQKKPLKFKAIKEANAIYSIASLRITTEEVRHFHVTITPPNERPFDLIFTRKLYAEP